MQTVRLRTDPTPVAMHLGSTMSSTQSTPVTRRPRAFSIAVLTALLTAGFYGVMGWLAYDLVDKGGSGFWSQVALRHLNPFDGYLFGPELDSDLYVPWLVGALVAVLVVFVLVGLFCRGGVVAAFAGGWLATSVGTTVGVLASVYVRVKSTGDGVLTDRLSAAFSYGAHWGLVFGAAVGLVAALLTSVLRKRVGSDYDETPAEERTTSAYADLPS